MVALSEQSLPDDSPIPVTQGPQDGEPLRDALEDTMEDDVRAWREDHATDEATPLLQSQGDQKRSAPSWLPWKR
jgi:hypothetical protein